MRILCIQNDPLAGPGLIKSWANQMGYSLQVLKPYKEHINYSHLDNFDWLIILGGEMGSYDEDKFPWLAHEKTFLLNTIKSKIPILGICLGAQLIAEVLGCKVYPHEYQEIGWWPVKLEIIKTKLLNNVPKEFQAFQFHGDTFNMPEGAIRLASSEACKNQMFVYGDRIVGLQFHPEFSNNMIHEILDNLGNKIEPGRFVQQHHKIVDQTDKLGYMENILYTLLNNFINFANLAR